MQNPSDSKIAIIGLGHVGLPLAVEFGKRYDTLGFDNNQARSDTLRAHGKSPPVPCDAKHLPPHEAANGRPR